MKYLIWKELRENLKWAVLGFVFVYFTMTYAFFSENFFFESSSTIYFCSSVAAFLGFALGMIQIVFEAAPDRWAFLMHRPVSSRQIILSKIIVGVSLLTAIWVLVILLGIWQLLSLQKLAYPMYWFRSVPTFIATLVGIPAYLCGLLLVIWKPRSILARIAFLGPTALLALTMGQFMVTLTWNYLWVAALVIGVATLFLFFMALNTYHVSGEQSRANRLSNLTSIFGVTVGTFCGLIIVGVIGSQFIPNQSYALNKVGRLYYSTDGKIYRAESQYDNQKSEFMVASIRNIKAENDELYQEEIAKRELSNNELTYKPKISRSLESGSSYYLHYNFGPFRYGRKHQLNLNEVPGVLTVSKHEGLIYVYQSPRFYNKYVVTDFIGKNGYSTAFEGKPESFGTIQMIDQATSLVPTIRKGKFAGMNRVQHGKCLVVCSDAIYLLDGQEQKVEKIYSSPDGYPIISVSHAANEKKPIFIVEHTDSYRVFEARTENAHADEMRAMDTKPVSLYLPGKEVGLIPRKGDLKNVKLRDRWNSNTYYLSENQTLMFTKENLITTQLFEVNFQGEIVNRERLNKKELKLGSYNYKPPISTKLSSVFVPPAILGFAGSAQAFQEEGFEHTKKNLSKEWPVVILFLTSWAGFVAVSVWYSKKQRLTAGQAQRSFWATLLAGPSGLLAFLFIEQPVHRELCPDCSQEMSVRFENCPACGAERKPLAENAKNIISEKLVVPKADGITNHPTTQTIST